MAKPARHPFHRGGCPAVKQSRHTTVLTARVKPAVLAAFATALWLASCGAAQAQALLERSPYRICLVVTTDNSPGLLQADAAALQERLLQEIESRIGGVWQVELPTETATSPAANEQRPPISLRHVARRGLRKLDQVEPEQLAVTATGLDKILFVHVGTAAWGAYDVTAREFDVRTQTLGTVAWLECAQRPMLPSLAFQALLRAFSPLAEVETVSGKEATLRLKAAALPLPDKKLQFVQPGDIFRATVRFNYRDGSLRRLHPIEWTFLVAQQVEGPVATCEVFTGLRSPLSARRRGLVEQLAVVVRPTYGETQLKLVASGTSEQPLPGYTVHAQVPGEVATTPLGTTDRQGQLVIPPVATPLRILLIMHGGELLARLPIVPGLEPQLVAKVPDDRVRFQVEAAMAGIQEQVIDVYARRTVLLSQCEAQLEAGNMELAKRLLEELRKLKTAEAFQAELNQLERRTFVNDPRMKRRIDKLIGDTRQVVQNQLGDGEVDRLATEFQKRTQQ